MSKLLPGALCLSALFFASAHAAEKPNILVILGDDLGQRDLGCYGSDLYRTPHLDRLASQGTRFTRAYTAAHVCSPTRASLLTGKFPARLHLTDWLTGHVKPHAKLRIPEWATELPQSEVTLAEMLKPSGYATAWLGKWHLGQGAPDHGFDAGNQSWELNRKKDEDDPKGVFTLTKEAIEFIDQNKERPFFLSVSHYAPHGPVRFNEKLKDEYQATVDAKNPRQSNAGYAAMIEAFDTSIGQLLEALDQRKLTDNTLVLFLSDNGGELNFTNNTPLREGKGTLYEGGVRIPLIARWPGKIPAGQVSDTVICSVDLFPTFAAVAGGSLPQNIDGVNITDVLSGKKKELDRTLCWHYPHYHREKPSGSILKGDWKLIEWFESGKTELFRLDQDPYEQNDLAEKEPQRAAELLGELNRWRKDVGAQMPTPNPDYDPETADLTEQQLKKKQAKAEKR
ncbi:MAG TPA: sulfatase [Caulifigura sp.]|nr:sulfatase [Caulifigura sp.]